MKNPDKRINAWKLPYPVFRCTEEEVVILKRLLTRRNSLSWMIFTPFLCTLIEQDAPLSDRTRAHISLGRKVQASCETESTKTLDNYFVVKGVYTDNQYPFEDQAYKRWIWIIKLINHNRGKRHAK